LRGHADKRQLVCELWGDPSSVDAVGFKDTVLEQGLVDAVGDGLGICEVKWRVSLKFLRICMKSFPFAWNAVARCCTCARKIGMTEKEDG
jgi:hypothetical protein